MVCPSPFLHNLCRSGSEGRNHESADDLVRAAVYADAGPRTLVAALLSALAALGQTPPEIPRGKHGAADMAYQERQLQKLQASGPRWDVSKPPAGFDPVAWAAAIPQDNKMTPDRVELGKKLYFDTRLSSDGSVACATCHDVTRGFTDQRAVSVGVKSKLGKRNAPTTLNVTVLETLFWDGRAPTLERQAGMPILNPVEMGMPDEAAALKAIRDDPEYQAAFKSAYGREVNYEDLERAIAAFERTLVFVDSPFRRFLGGDDKAISAQARAGWELFNGKARCMSLSPDESLEPAGHRQSLPQRRRFGPASEFRGPGHEGAGGDCGRTPRRRNWTS